MGSIRSPTFQRTVQVALAGLVVLCVVVSAQKLTNQQSMDASYALMRQYSSNDSDLGLTPDEFLTFLKSATSHTRDFIDKVLGECVVSPQKNCSKKAECLGIEEVYAIYAVDGRLPAAGFMDALPVVLNTLNSDECTRDAQETTLHVREKRRPTMGEAWGYGIGFVIVIVIISNIGACLGPIMEKRFFKRLLQFLVAMGAGSLASTGLLVLIPEAFDIMSIEELGTEYVWKSTVAILTIYLFFTSERFLKTFLYSRRARKEKESMSITVNTSDLVTSEDPSVTPLTKENGHGHSHFPSGSDRSEDKLTLAWMVMTGDVIHNFVDGLSIGAAFTEDVSVGISISLAIVCEELPHELADIAILLHSGLSIKKALLINFLSACVCFIGLIIGIVMGSMVAHASRWIFAMAGGLFLYIPLVDMLPDMSLQLDLLIRNGGHEAKVVACLHVFGLALGTAIIIFIVNVSSFIDVS